MKKFSFLTIVFVFALSSVNALVNETISECEYRYGDHPRGINTKKDIPNGEMKLVYKKFDVTIECYFENDATDNCTRIKYILPLRDKYLANVLNVLLCNNYDSGWLKGLESAEETNFISSDERLFAIYNRSENSLEIKSAPPNNYFLL